MLKSFKSFWRLSLQEKVWFCQAWFLMARWHITIKYVPYRYWRDQVICMGGSRTPPNFPVRQFIAVTEMAARHHIFKINCLRRCVVQRYLLGCNGVSARIHFGVKLGVKTQAHCWLTIAGEVINDGPDVLSQYTELTLAANRGVLGAFK